MLDLIRFEGHVPKKYFKALIDTNGLYEVKVVTPFKSIRILCFFDQGDLVVLTNCFLKKIQKTPKREIALAKRLKKEYFEQKTI